MLHMKFGYIWPSGFRRGGRLKVSTDDGRTTEAAHTKSSPGAFGSGELKTPETEEILYVLWMLHLVHSLTPMLFAILSASIRCINTLYNKPILFPGQLL